MADYVKPLHSGFTPRVRHDAAHVRCGYCGGVLVYSASGEALCDCGGLLDPPLSEPAHKTEHKK